MKRTRTLILDESARTGVEEIDQQHQSLLNLVNDVHLSLANCETSVNTRSIVQELLGYSIHHFNTEESLIKEHAISADEKTAAAAHIAQHRQFSRQIVSFQEKLLKREYVDKEELLAFLTGWINEHLFNADKSLEKLLLSGQEE